MSLGPLEIILIILVIALLFGAKRLPELMKGMGQGVREFRNEVKDPAHLTPSASESVQDVPSRRLGEVDPVTGAPVVNEPVVQVPGERR